MEAILKVPGLALFDQDRKEEEEQQEQEKDEEGFGEVVADGIEEEEDANQADGF